MIEDVRNTCEFVLRGKNASFSVVTGLVMLGNLLYTRTVSNQVSKLQGQLDNLYKTMNSEKNKKDDKLLDKK